MWAVSSHSLSDILHKSIEKRKPAKFFVSLHETFKILLNFFYGDKVPQDGGLQSTKRLLELFSSEPEALVQAYYRQRYIQSFEPVLRIYETLVQIRIRIRGSIPLTKRSGSCNFLKQSSRCQQRVFLLNHIILQR
jgi:hypothetical protein